MASASSDPSPSKIRKSLSILFNRLEGRESVIDGVRALAILWVFFLHIVFFHFGTFTEEVLGIFSGRWTQWILQGVLGVDMFFVISGYLIGTILLKELQKTESIDLRMFYARRFLRLTPVYVVVMVLAIPFMQNIPKSAVLMDIAPSGNAEWAWANLIYVNNFVTITKQYMGWCWSLAIEEQFYLVAPLFLLLVVGRTRQRMLWMLTLLAASGFIRLGIITANDLIPPFNDSPDTPTWAFRFDTIYDKLYTRFGGLLAGIVGAYLSLYHLEALKRFFGHKMRSYLIGSVCLFIFGYIACLSTGSPKYEGMPKLLAQLVYSHHRDVFSIAVMLIIFVAIYGRGWLAVGLNRFLSSNCLYPIAQLSYSIYLVHEVVMIWIFPKTTPFFVENWGLGFYPIMAINGLIAVLATVAITVSLYALVERPSMDFRKSPRFKRFVLKTSPT